MCADYNICLYILWLLFMLLPHLRTSVTVERDIMQTFCVVGMFGRDACRFFNDSIIIYLPLYSIKYYL